MSITSSRSAFTGGDPGTQARRTDPLIQHRRFTALVLTGGAVALGIILVAACGRDALTIYFSQLPVALALLWSSTTAKRFDERGEPAGLSDDARTRTPT